MNTPMEAKLELLVDTSSELIDATLYRQIIGSLMYLMNTRPDINPLLRIDHVGIVNNQIPFCGLVKW